MGENYSMTNNQGRTWKYSYSVVESIKEFAVSERLLGLLVLTQLS